MYQRLRRRPADADQRRHPPAAGAAAREQPAPHRAAEQPAVLDARHAGDLLRRRDRHGRQHLSRRSQRRPHADAVDRRPQRRLLARRPGAALRAADHGSGLRLPGDQRRGAGARSPYSLLNWMRRMHRRCASSITVFGRGTIEFLPAPQPQGAGLRAPHDDETILCVANLSRSVQPVELDLSRFKGMIPVEMLGLTEFPRIGELPYFLTLGAVRVLLVPAAAGVRRRSAQRRRRAVAARSPQAPGAARRRGVGDAARRQRPDADRAGAAAALPAAPALVRRQGAAAARARFIDWGVLRRGPQPIFLTIVEVEFDEDADAIQYFLPLTVCTSGDAKGGGRAGAARHPGDGDRRPQRRAVRRLARRPVRRHAAREPGHQEQTKTRRGAIRASQTAAPSPRCAATDDGLAVSRARRRAEQHVDHLRRPLILKLFRRIEPGINPDFEIGRQLTETSGFRACRPWRRRSSTRRRRRAELDARSAWCSSWSRARPTAGPMRPTSSGGSTIRSRARSRRPCSPRRFTELATPTSRAGRRGHGRRTSSSQRSSAAGPPRCTWRSRRRDRPGVRARAVHARGRQRVSADAAALAQRAFRTLDRVCSTAVDVRRPTAAAA